MNEDVRGRLQAIYEEHGKLTPTLAVADAKDPRSPLHEQFDWNDETAGRAHRIDQARRLIQSFRLVFRSDDSGRERDVRYFQTVRTEEGHHYVPTVEVVKNPFLTQLVMADMEREWRQLKKRYEAFEEFWHMIRGDMDGGIGKAAA